MSTPYHFVTEWRVVATVDEVKAVLKDGLSLPRWWPAVYLDVEEVDPGDENALGRTLDLHTTGWMPYTLHWTLRVTEAMTDTGFALAATGDLEGTGRWTFEPQGSDVLITYDWRVMATKPLLRRLSRLLRPAFSANHHWAMKTGEESLRLELRRRRGEAVPPPPPPTFRWLLRRHAS